jgi:tetratricopeptide (TPR) repeat protein
MHLARAHMLFSQGRYAEARKHLMQAIAEVPGEPISHALLAQCTLSLGEKADALQQAEEAVRLGPDIGHTHYVMAMVLSDMDKPREAEIAVQEAIRLEPDEAAYFGMHATILTLLRRWGDALKAADQGLALDAENEICLNLRALALTQLGRKSEAAETIQGALQTNPDNAFTHANNGWTSLHRGQHKQALEHFREALRLDPTLEFAREGLVEALKARHVIYRIMLAYFLWMSRLSGRAQMAVILVGYFGSKFLRQLAKTYPDIAPYVLPVTILYSLFVLMTWLANPLFEMLLCFSRYGRYALSARQRGAAYALMATLSGTVLLVSIGLAANSKPTWIAGLILAGLTIPLTTTIRAEPGWRRSVLIALTACLVLLGAGAVALGSAALGPTLFVAFVIGVLVFFWVGSLTSVSRAG